METMNKVEFNLEEDITTEDMESTPIARNFKRPMTAEIELHLQVGLSNRLYTKVNCEVKNVMELKAIINEIKSL